MDSFAEKLIKNGQTSLSNYLLANFTKIGMTPAEFVVFLQLKRYAGEGILFPKVERLTASTGYRKSQVYEILHQMIKKKLMRITTVKRDNGDTYDRYNFDWLDQKLAVLSEGHQDNNDSWDLSQNDHPYYQSKLTVDSRQSTFRAVEREFGRQLSPIELSQVSRWLDVDNYTPKMIFLALREAVLNQVYNLKYIDRILENWYQRGLRTPEALQTFRNRRHQEYYRNRDDDSGPHQKRPPIPIFKI